MRQPDLMTAAVYALADFAGLIDDPALDDATRAAARLGRQRLADTVGVLNPTLTTLPDKMPVLAPDQAAALARAVSTAGEDLSWVAALALEPDEAHGPALRAARRLERAARP